LWSRGRGGRRCGRFDAHRELAEGYRGPDVEHALNLPMCDSKLRCRVGYAEEGFAIDADAGVTA
jgi:hypothetical protein